VRTFFLLAAALFSSVMAAAPIVDGVVQPGEYGPAVGHYTPLVTGVLRQDVYTYFYADTQYFYGAIVADTSKPINFNGANIYLYSSGANGGVYGDGDDVIVEGLTSWKFSLNVWPWGTSPQPLGTVTPLGPNIEYVSDGDVSVARNLSSYVTEFKMDRALLGNYSTLRYGGQFYSYEFHRGSDNAQPGAIVSTEAVPEPASTSLIAIGLGALLIGRRRLR
jgi:hypothetical protein